MKVNVLEFIKKESVKLEEKARKYAESKGIKNYELVDLQPFNPKKTKIKIVIG